MRSKIKSFAILKMYFSFWILILLLISSQLTYSQSTGKIRGRVFSQESNEPLVGANVLIIGSNQGAATGIDGSYIIIKCSTRNLFPAFWICWLSN